MQGAGHKESKRDKQHNNTWGIKNFPPGTRHDTVLMFIISQCEESGLQLGQREREK